MALQISSDNTRWSDLDTTLAAGVATKNHTGMTASTTRYYCVRSKNTGGNSGYSSADAKAQQQSRALRELRDDTVIAVDLGDITKPHSKTLECVGRVADGSDGHKIKPSLFAELKKA